MPGNLPQIAAQRPNRVNRGDHWMTADEAQAYGLVDKVIYKR